MMSVNITLLPITRYGLLLGNASVAQHNATRDIDSRSLGVGGQLSPATPATLQDFRAGTKKKSFVQRHTFSISACHPCAGAMLIFSV